jgi:hypothetical protein
VLQNVTFPLGPNWKYPSDTPPDPVTTIDLLIYAVPSASLFAFAQVISLATMMTELGTMVTLDDASKV